MRKMVIYTYFLVQFFTVSFGLIQIELARTGAAEMQPILWLLQLLKSVLAVILAMATDSKEKLPHRLYFPQMLLDIVYMTSTSNLSSWLVVGLGYALLLAALYSWDGPKRVYNRLFAQTVLRRKMDLPKRHVQFFGMRRSFSASSMQRRNRYV